MSLTLVLPPPENPRAPTAPTVLVSAMRPPLVSGAQPEPRRGEEHFLRIVSQSASAHDGAVVDVSDARIRVGFTDAANATRFALALRARSAEPLQIAISPSRRETGPLGRLCDAMAAATPPGALVADAAIARAATVAGAPFSSIGLWRLPGFEGRFSLCIVGDPAPFGGVPADRSNLPDPVGALIGRDALVHLLRDEIHDGARVVSVTGLPGAGRRRVCNAVAASTLGDWTGGAWTIDAGDLASTTGLAHRIARAVGASTPAAGLRGAQDLARDLAARGRTLIVLERASRQDALSHVLGALVRGAPEVVFLCAAASPLGLDGERVVPLPGLAMPDALALLRQRCAGRMTLQDLDHPSTTMLLERIDRSPQAIEVVAEAVIQFGPQETLDRIRRDPAAVFSFGAGGGALAASVDAALVMLPPMARDAVSQLTSFNEDFSAEAAAAVIRATHLSAVASPSQILSTLREHGLVRERPGPGGPRLEIPHLVRDRLAGDRDANASCVAARARHTRYFTALAAAELEAARRGDPSALARLEADKDDLIAVLERTLRPATENPLLSAVDLVLARRASVSERVAVLDRVAPHARGDLADEIGLRRVEALIERGALADAGNMARNIVDRLTGRGQPAREVEARVALATAWARAGKGRAAITEAEDALKTARKADLRAWMSGAHRALGEALMAVGDAEAAIREANEALECARDAEHRDAEARAALLCAELHLLLGAADEASGMIAIGLAQAEATADPGLLGCAYALHGRARLEAGAAKPAEHALSKAVNLLRGSGRRHGGARADVLLARTIADQGRPADAIDALARSMRELRELGATPDEAWARLWLATICEERGNRVAARTWYNEAKSAFSKAQHGPGEALSLGAIAALDADEGRTRGAAELLGQARRLFEGSGPLAAQVLDLRAARLHVAELRGDRDLDGEHLAALQTRIEAATESAAGESSWVLRSAEVRATLRLLERALAG
jgi:tetratricopeptide (TPR) repeat protein